MVAYAARTEQEGPMGRIVRLVIAVVSISRTREDIPLCRISCHCERSEAISIPLRTAMEIAASLRS